jgi:hypothetical protein
LLITGRLPLSEGEATASEVVRRDLHARAVTIEIADAEPTPYLLGRLGRPRRRAAAILSWRASLGFT